MYVRACTRRPVVSLPSSARRRPAGRGGPRWVHPFPQEPADRTGGEHGDGPVSGDPTDSR